MLTYQINHETSGYWVVLMNGGHAVTDFGPYATYQHAMAAADRDSLERQSCGASYYGE